MVPALLAALLALSAAQAEPGGSGSSGGADAPAGEGSPVPPGSLSGSGERGAANAPVGGAVASAEASALAGLVDSLGWAWVQKRPLAGPRLETGAQLQTRVNSLQLSSGKQGTTSEFNFTPAFTYGVEERTYSGTFGYSPNVYIPGFLNGGPVSVLHRVGGRGDWWMSSRWSSLALLSVMAGTFSQLKPEPAQGGSGPQAPNPKPVTSVSSYQYLSVNATARAGYRLSAVSTLWLVVDYADVGGLGEVGRQNQPRSSGPRAELLLDVRQDLVSSIATYLTASETYMKNGAVGVVQLETHHKIRWPSGIATTAGFGVAGADARSGSSLALGKYLPVMRLEAGLAPALRHAAHFAVEATLSPFVNSQYMTTYDRATLRASVDWEPQTGWTIESFLAMAYEPRRQQKGDAYGIGGLSLHYRPNRAVVVEVGGNFQRQVASASGVGGLLQWTTYLSASFRRFDSLR